MPQPTAEYEPLSLQERALASAMIQKVGDTTVRFAIDDDGIRRHETPRITETEFAGLVTEFRDDPKESLAWARESLAAIPRDSRLADEEKDDRLGRYLDAYLELTLKLDHTAFPPTKPGEVKQGVPEYMPDGFVDMGGESSLDPSRRNREMIHIDKREIFTQYKPVLKELFAIDYGEATLAQRKKHIVERLAHHIYYNLPHTGGNIDLGNGKVGLAQLSEGVCRHQALVFQVLAQAMGLKTTVLKSRMESDGKELGRHSSNMARIDGQWYNVDVSNPDFEEEDGRKQWRLGVFKTDAPPEIGETKVYGGTLKHRGIERVYRARDDMYWTIDPPSS